MRTANYHNLKIAVLWLAVPNKDLATKKVQALGIGKWGHTAKYERIYSWQLGQLLSPVHFGEHRRQKWKGLPTNSRNSTSGKRETFEAAHQRNCWPGMRHSEVTSEVTVTCLPMYARQAQCSI